MAMPVKDSNGVGGSFGILLAVGISLLSCSHPSPAQDAPSGQTDQISRLVHQLRSDSYQEREDAAEKLKDIGVPALDVVRTASQTGDLDFRRLSGKVVKYLEHVHAARTVNGAEFRLAADPVWQIPEPGKKSPVRIDLAITNQTREKLQFGLLRTFGFVLVTRNGDYVSGISGVSNGFKYPPPSLALIGPGDTYRWSEFGARLSWDGQDLELVGEDGFGIPWSFHHLAPGRYLLYVQYHQLRSFMLSGIAVWAGKTTTNSVAIKIEEGARR